MYKLPRHVWNAEFLSVGGDASDTASIATSLQKKLALKQLKTTGIRTTKKTEFVQLDCAEPLARLPPCSFCDFKILKFQIILSETRRYVKARCIEENRRYPPTQTKNQIFTPGMFSLLRLTPYESATRPGMLLVIKR